MVVVKDDYVGSPAVRPSFATGVTAATDLDRLAAPGSVLYAKAEIGPYAGAEVLAPDKVRIHLHRPFEPLLRNLSSTKLGIISPSAVAKYGDVFGQNPVGWPAHWHRLPGSDDGAGSFVHHRPPDCRGDPAA